jgi:translation initiation factor 4A
MSYTANRRNEEWSGGESKNGPNEKDQSYDGPPGMDPDGIIESNWEEVALYLYLFIYHPTGHNLNR